MAIEKIPQLNWLKLRSMAVWIRWHYDARRRIYRPLCEPFDEGTWGQEDYWGGRRWRTWWILHLRLRRWVVGSLGRWLVSSENGSWFSLAMKMINFNFTRDFRGPYQFDGNAGFFWNCMKNQVATSNINYWVMYHFNWIGIFGLSPLL